MPEKRYHKHHEANNNSNENGNNSVLFEPTSGIFPVQVTQKLNSLWAGGEYDQLIEQLDIILKYYPYNTHCLLAKAYCFYELAELRPTYCVEFKQKAVELLDMTITLEPSYSQAYLARDECLAGLEGHSVNDLRFFSNLTQSDFCGTAVGAISRDHQTGFTNISQINTPIEEYIVNFSAREMTPLGLGANSSEDCC
jgi:hypothetical protein